MGEKLYSKLAFDNIKNNKSTYFPYMFSSVIIVALFFILVSMKGSTDTAAFVGSRTMEMILNLGINVTALFSLMFLFYTNSFLMKRRQKELGLYSVLGMEKKHIVKVIALEIIYSGLISIVLGLFFGLLFSKLMFAILLKLLNLDTSIRLMLSLNAVKETILIYTGVFLLVIAYNAFVIWRMSPLDLIRAKEKGEREPKAKWFVGILGLLSLTLGYAISLNLKNPILALPTLFVAIIFVSIGTYLFFTSGSILLLKLLRKRKNFYYKKDNFITISNMIYRMKQNAVGLANITILSTAVLLVLSTTFSLYIGMEDILESDYPRDVITKYSPDEQVLSVVDSTIDKHALDHNLEIVNQLRFYNLTAAVYHENNIFTSVNMVDKFNALKMKDLEIYTAEDYNKIYSENLSLDKNQIAVYSDTLNLKYSSLNIMGKDYLVKEYLDKDVFYPDKGFVSATIIVSDFKELEALQIESVKLLKEKGSSYPNRILRNYYFNIEGNAEDKMDFGQTLRQTLRDEIEDYGEVRDVYTSKLTYLSQYGSLFFVGLFLGILFLVATVLIIYFKQISEGYQDQERYEILQKVGMTKEEVKSTINTQIKFVFFSPVLMSVIHIAFAFPLLKKVLGLLGLSNNNLFGLVTFTTIAVFALFYTLVYHQTAKVYYKIVN